MGRIEPNLPRETCPKIDEVINVLKELKGCEYIMEELRSANSDLRDYGEYWREKAEEFEARVDELLEDLEKAENERNTHYENYQELLKEIRENG